MGSGDNQNNKFLFDVNVFDAHGKNVAKKKPDSVVEPPPKTYTQNDIDRAAQEGFTKGQNELKQSQSDIETNTINTTLKQMKMQIDLLITCENERNEQFETDSLKLLYNVTDKVFPNLLDKYGKDILLDKLKSALAFDIGRPSLTAHVPHTMESDIKNHLQESGLDTTLCVKKNSDADDMGCAVTWSSGGYDINLEKVLNKTKTILTELLEETGETRHDKESHSENEEPEPPQE